jgi:predicted phage terminase large subunit-like protein
MISGKNSEWVKTKVKEIGSLSWNDLLDWVRVLDAEAMAGDLQAEKDLRDLWYWRCATDEELFAFYYFPHYCQHPFNEFHRDHFATSNFMERAIRRARAAPRGYAKSTLKALIKPIHDVCYALEKYIVIISNTQDQANQKLRDIRSEVLTNAALAADYGIHFRTRKPGETQYTLYCGKHACMFTCYGAGVEIRGIRFGASRPTKIILDDSEHSEEVHNEALRKKDEDWFFQVVSNLGNEFTNIEVIGTVLHKESRLMKLIKNPAYDGRIFKAVISWSERQDLWDKWTQIYTNLDNPNRLAEADYFYRENERELLKGTKVLWPEKESYLYLMKELVEKGRRSFFKEKQNEPIGGDEALFERFHFYHETADGLFVETTKTLLPWSELKDQQGRWLNAYGVIDPATGQTKAKPGKLSDFACLLTGIKDKRGRLLVHQDWTKRAAPTKQIESVFEHHLEFDYQKFGVETNLYRNLMLPNMVAERKRREQEVKKAIQLPFYDIEQVENKEKRIYTVEPKVTHGWVLLNRALSQEFMGQLEAFPHADHDDCPDALEMLWGLVNNRYKACGVSIDAMGGR